MGYEVEDEIDWSDSPLATTPPPAQDFGPSIEVEPYLSTPSFEDEDSGRKFEVRRTPTPFAESEHWELPYGEPLASPSTITSAASGPGLSRLKRAKIGIKFNHREPTKEDYSHFTLYQASQKTYEAVFLKTFLAHALHPQQVKACFDRTSDDLRHVEQYLQSVMTNVNQIVTKMIWNAHSRTINMMANDGKEYAHFWDFRQFNKYSFSDFSVANTVPVVHKLSESWHSDFSHPPMVRYTPKDYPVGKYTSPIEEIDEVAATLFKSRKLDDTLSSGRPVKHPSKHKKGRSLRTDAPRTERDCTSRRDWVNQLIAGSVPNESNKAHHPLAQADAFENTRCGSQIEPVDDIAPRLFNQDQEHPGIDEDAYITPTYDSNIGLRKDSPHEKTTHLETLVHHYGPNVLLDASAVIDREESIARQASKNAESRAKLIKDMFRRVMPRPASQKRYIGKPPTIKTIISRAVKKDIIKPPTPEVQERIDRAALIELTRRKAHVAGHKKARSTTKAIVQTQHHNETSRKAATNINPTKKAASNAKDTAKTGPNTPGTSSPESTHGQKTSSSSSPEVSHEESNTHPSGSKTLETHQALPPNAYFESTFDTEQLAWRCGIKHAMGYYYNAGDRRNCVGCFTAITHNPKAKRMDFYLPSRKYFYQPAPGITWTPSKDHGKTRRSKVLSHNSIAKEAFWSARNAGATDDEARRKAVEAVEAHLRPKTPPRQPTPEPSPEPIDLGPHPSGSLTMEHDQNLPEGAYWEESKEGERLAWRCDVNHALGRYYLAGNKYSCPGCGSNKNGLGKQKEMDFYLPSGVVVRQAAPGLNNWTVRKPYKTKCNQRQTNKPVALTHNQICSKKYWAAVEDGVKHDAALALAIKKTNIELDAQLEAKAKAKKEADQAKKKTATEQTRKIEKVTRKASRKVTKPSKGNGKSLGIAKSSEVVDSEEDSEQEKVASESSHSDTDSPALSEIFSDELTDDSSDGERLCRISRGVVLPSTGDARKRNHSELNDNDFESDQDDEDTGHRSKRHVSAISISSEDESISSSDSE